MKSTQQLKEINHRNRMFSEIRYTESDTENFNAKYNPAERAAMIVDLIQTDTLGFKSMLNECDKLDEKQIHYIYEKECMIQRKVWEKPDSSFDTAFIIGVAIARGMLIAKEMEELKNAAQNIVKI